MVSATSPSESLAGYESSSAGRHLKIPFWGNGEASLSEAGPTTSPVCLQSWRTSAKLAPFLSPKRTCTHVLWIRLRDVYWPSLPSENQWIKQCLLNELPLLYRRPYRRRNYKISLSLVCVYSCPGPSLTQSVPLPPTTQGLRTLALLASLPHLLTPKTSWSRTQSLRLLLFLS